jgi:hypothetical protein
MSNFDFMISRVKTTLKKRGVDDLQMELVGNRFDAIGGPRDLIANDDPALLAKTEKEPIPTLLKEIPSRILDVTFDEPPQDSPHHKTWETDIRNAYFLSNVHDPAILAKYCISLLLSMMNYIISIRQADIRAFTQAQRLLGDDILFGHLLTAYKLGYPSGKEMIFFQPEIIISEYKRFSRELTLLSSAIKISPQNLPSVKSVYPVKKEKKKIKFRSPR